MVRCSCIPNCDEIVDHIAEVNCGPLSDVISKGTPNLEIHVLIRALAYSVVVVSRRGIASGQGVVLSIMVRRCVKPEDGVRGPTILIWI